MNYISNIKIPSAHIDWMNFNDHQVNLWKVLYELIWGGLNEESERLWTYINDNFSKGEEKSKDTNSEDSLLKFAHDMSDDELELFWT